MRPSKDTSKTKEKRSLEWDTYEAILDNVYFEYPSPFPDEPIGEVEEKCREYLDRFTNGYTMREFYLKKKGLSSESHS